MPDAVTLAYVHDVELATSFQESLQSLLFFDAGEKARIVGPGGFIALRCGTGGLVEARNNVVEAFLGRDAEWLFWIDTDMGFQPDVVEQLLAASDPVERPIVGGLCFAQKETTPDGYGGYRTKARVTILDWVKKPDGSESFMGRRWYPVNELVRCAGTGSACILIHRSVLEKMAAEYGATWYDRINGDDGNPLGEDVSFCIRASALDFPIHVHTGVRTTHLKRVWLAEEDFWSEQVAPPATVPTAVIVPVLDRPYNAQPFMESLRASTGIASVTAIAEMDDLETVAAWEAAGAEVITGPSHTFAEKVNVGYDMTDEPWIFIVGDDVRFHPGWLDHAQHIASTSEAKVIGTNDLGNPRVMRGEHATHLLIARDYIDSTGASWDGPETVCHEGYHHWFVDDEIVTAAKLRGVWAMALGSKVEHLHPIWGKAETDKTYELGKVHNHEDGKLFRARAKKHAA